MPNLNDTLHIKPCDGCTVGHEPPSREKVPEGGQQVIWSLWWERRLSDGCIEVVTPKATKTPKPKTTKKRKEG